MTSLTRDTPRWSITKLHPRFGAELSGHRISADTDRNLLRQILDHLHQYGVIVIRGQDLPDAGLADLAKSLGNPRDKSPFSDRDFGVFRLSNLDQNDEILPSSDSFLRMNDANELWHTDSTYIRPRASVSLLHSRIVPPEGGRTEFCDTRCAYEDLDPELRALIAGKTAFHSLIHSRSLVGYDDWTPEVRARLVSIERPLVHMHRESGRTAICLAAHISRISPMESDAASDALLATLMDAATTPDRVYSHEWRVGDLLLWDNRCTMHRARPYDQLKWKRDLRSIRLDDDDDIDVAA